MTNPVTRQIKFGQVVDWWDSPWRCGTIERQDKVVLCQVTYSTHELVTDCLMDLDELHWDNIASVVRNTCLLTLTSRRHD